MNFIAHRVNTIEELDKTPSEFGIEVDLRDKGSRLITQHEPFKDGDDFEEFLGHYKHDIMILNVKCEGIEFRILELIKKYGIKEYFFLDSSFPMIYRLCRDSEKNIAIRFSEFEGLDSALLMKNKINWIWVDCFTILPIVLNNYRILRNAGFKLCLASPDLHGRPEDIEKYKQYLKRENIVFDYICTKIHNIDRWK